MPRLHITGASGAGTTTLGRALAAALGCAHLDSDDYYWLPTRPRYRSKREIGERQSLLMRDLLAEESWILSGSLVSWGEPAVPLFELVVYVRAPTEARLRRLRAREEERYARDPDRTREEFERDREEFLLWAAGYDGGGIEMRSRAAHEAWLATLTCPVLRVDGTSPVEEAVRAVLAR